MQAQNQDSVRCPEDSGHFDPLKDVLMAQFAKPAELNAVNLRALSPFHRALLIIDGTLTTFLEVYTLEPVELKRLNHLPTRLTSDNEWLEVKSGSEIVLREVMIQGRQSHSLYAYAVASVALDRLPEEVSRELVAPGGSLGRVLNEQKIETRREILWYGREKNEHSPAAIRALYDGSFLCRTYRIIAGGKPVALIHEKFPSSIDAISSLE